MIGRLYNKMRKAERDERDRRARVRPWDPSLVDKSLRKLWDGDEPIGDTRMIVCACGRRARWHLAGATRVTFRCKKCGGKQTLIR